MVEPKASGRPMMKNNFRYWVFPDFRSTRGRIQVLLSFSADPIGFSGVQFEEVREAKCLTRLGVIRLSEHCDGEETCEREKMGPIQENDGKERGRSRLATEFTGNTDVVLNQSRGDSMETGTVVTDAYFNPD